MVYFTGRSQIPQTQPRIGTNLSTGQTGGVMHTSYSVYAQSPSNKIYSQRELSVNVRRSPQDFSSQLHVETSVEYDLPSHIYPPKNAEPILMIKPDYMKKKVQKPITNSLGNFLVPGSSPGHGSNNVQYLNTSSTNKRSSKNNTSCTKTCYATCNYQDSPSVYSKSSNTSRNRSNSTLSNLSSVPSTPEHSNKSNSSKSSKQRQSNYNQQLRTSQQQFVQSQMNNNVVYQLPPPSYATATALYNNIRPSAHAASMADINTPRAASMVPSELGPQIMSTAHIVRSRGSPKVRTSTRRHHVPEYQMRRRSNTVGAQSALATSVSKNTVIHNYQQEKMASDVARLNLARYPTQHFAEAIRKQHELEEGKKRLQKVSAVPYIYEGRPADTPHMTSGPLTPAEMMDQGETNLNLVKY